MHWSTCSAQCTEFSALVHRELVHRISIRVSCGLFKNISIMPFNQLPDDVILRIFSFISFHLIRRTISLVCKKWHRISGDASIVRKAPSVNLESIRLHECLTYWQLKNVVRRVIWVCTADIKFSKILSLLF